MKMIRSFLIIATAMAASTTLHAQEQQLKAEIAKPVASNIPPPGSRPVLAPDMKPESKNVTFQRSEEAITVAPLPSDKKTEGVKAAPLKPTGVITDEKIAVTPPVMLPNDQNTKPLPGPAPAVLKKEN